MFQLFWILFSLFMFLISDKILKAKMVAQMVGSEVDDVAKEDDLSVQIVARISFVLLLFHSVIFVITLARNEVAAHVHDGCWAVKFFIVGSAFVASWWIDSSFFNLYYLPVAKYLSAIFLIVQVF